MTDKRSPFDYIKSISETKTYMMESKEDESDYVPFLVNRHFSFLAETLFYAQEMNINNIIDKKLHYDYYFHSLSKKKRYAKWSKKKEENNLDLVIKYYGFSVSKAKQALLLLDDDKIKIIKNKLEKGGLI